MILPSDIDVEIDELNEIYEADGKLSSQQMEDKLMKSVMQNDEKAVDDGKLISESFNQGLSSFNPDIMFENIVNNFSMAKKIYGEALVRLISGYNSSYVERNINIPEFQRELKKKFEDKAKDLKEKKLIKRDNSFSDDGLKLASLIMYTEELDKMISKGMFGEKIQKKISHYGDRGESKPYRKGDRYKDIAIRDSLKMAIRRGHKTIKKYDLKTSEREAKGQVQIIYALDASGSMKGKKIEVCKKAGIALAYKAIENKDKVGLIVFGSEIEESLPPMDDFSELIKHITKVTAKKQTNFKDMLHKSLELFPKGDYTKHLIVLTDAMPTVGKDPKKDALKEMSRIHGAGITVSMVGINLDKEAKYFAERLVAIGEGKLYIVKQLEDLDKIILEDYYSVS